MMIRGMNTLFVAGLLTLLLSPPALSQPGMGRRGGGMGRSMMQRMYDTTTVQTVTGEVTAVDSVAGGGWFAGGLHCILKSGTSSLDVHLGPVWFLQSKGMKIAKGDNVTVTGSRITVGGKAALVASRVQKGDVTLELRDRSGVPLWSRRNR